MNHFLNFFYFLPTHILGLLYRIQPTEELFLILFYVCFCFDVKRGLTGVRNGHENAQHSSVQSA